MSRLQLLAIVFLPLLGPSLGSAQAISVRTLALRPGQLPEVYLKGPSGHQVLSFSNVQPNETVLALPANPLPLYRSGINAEGKEVFTVAHEVKVPTGAKGILLLAWTTGSQTRYVAVDDDFGAARFNDWLLINTCARPVALLIGEGTKPVVIAAGTSTHHRIAVAKGKGATVLARASFNGKVKTFFSTFWPVHPDRRAVVLFVDDGSKIRVKRISDKLTPAAP